jgi:hypothetical protein
MGLSNEEWTQARVAFREIATIKQRKRFWFTFGLLILNSVFQLIGQLSEHHRLIWIGWFQLGFLILILGFGIYRGFQDRRLLSRYAGNVEMLRVLGEREPGLTDSFPDPFAYSPFLEAWNRRLGRHALLWRLDHFLSGKGWPARS